MQPLHSNQAFSLLGLCHDIISLKKAHFFLIVNGLINDLICQTKLVSLYSSFGQIECARSVFDQIQDPDLYSWKVMFRWYLLSDSYSEIVQLYTCLKKCLNERDDMVFSVVLKACAEIRGVDEGRKLHCEIVKVGFSDSFVLTGLVDMYAKCGEVESSRLVFDETCDRDVVSWTSMIVSYVQNDCFEEGLVLFNGMRWCLVDPNQFTIVSLLAACSKLGALHQGKWVHGYMIKEGIDLNSFVVSALLDMYGKCGTVMDARLVFNEFDTAELVSWTSMIAIYTQRGFPSEALKLFLNGKWARILPNSLTIASVLSACGQLNDLNLGKAVHSFGIRLGLDNSAVRNALVNMYAKCHVIQDARRMFDMVSDKDVVAWNSMITGYSQNGYAIETLELLHTMRYSLSLDATTMVCVLSACACLGVLYLGCALHAYALKEGFLSSNVYVGTALVNLYSKCGDFAYSRKVFDEMREKNKVTWSAMMSGYGMNGDPNESFKLFEKMAQENEEPNDIVFTSILSACSHTGRIGEAWMYFNSMCKDYNLVLSMKHYVCMIDLLARAGRIKEALEFIEKMPVQADVSVWGAVLHGCRVHSRMDLAEVAVRRMLELQPDDAGYYVLISNLYALDGRWDKVNQMRELMKEKGLNKCPGSSFVEMDDDDDDADTTGLEQAWKIDYLKIRWSSLESPDYFDLFFFFSQREPAALKSFGIEACTNILKVQ
ncbi:hypothetical protein Syun_023402 [Stephania yunnanensis]|uniref:Pentatricopeptide repeat-containing protein n=1 Tax=Stephania yunnanensis TaxID=152371 RepID=A0AAP0F8Y2_9MAGN